MAVHVHVDDDRVSVDLDGIDQVCALKRHVEIPMREIVDARVEDVESARSRIRWRIGGTAVPGVVTAGRYTVRDEPGERELWCVYRDHEVLVLETRDPARRRVVLQLPDRAEQAWYVGERIARD